MAISEMQARKLADDYTAAWNTGKPEAVASFFAETGGIVINRGPLWQGRAGVAAMAAGFFADVPDLTLQCDGVKLAGSHMLYLWTFTGTHVRTGGKLRITGWEEWELSDDFQVTASRGWFDPEEYARRTAG